MPYYRNEPVSFDCEIKDETDKAWLLVIDGEEHWIPKSIVHLDNHGKSVDDVVNMPTWKAEELGLA